MKVLPRFPQQVYAVRSCWEGLGRPTLPACLSTVTGLLNPQS